MTKDKDNIIQFPGTKKNKISEEQINNLIEETNYHKEETEMIEHTIDEVAIDVIRHLVVVLGRVLILIASLVANAFLSARQTHL